VGDEQRQDEPDDDKEGNMWRPAPHSNEKKERGNWGTMELKELTGVSGE